MAKKRDDNYDYLVFAINEKRQTCDEIIGNSSKGIYTLKNLLISLLIPASATLISAFFQIQDKQTKLLFLLSVDIFLVIVFSIVFFVHLSLYKRQYVYRKVKISFDRLFENVTRRRINDHEMITCDDMEQYTKLIRTIVMTKSTGVVIRESIRDLKYVIIFFIIPILIVLVSLFVLR